MGARRWSSAGIELRRSRGLVNPVNGAARYAGGYREAWLPPGQATRVGAHGAPNL